MNLVIFTVRYPFGVGEGFLEEEIRVAERKFDNILIVSYAKKSELLNKYVPHNAKIIFLRKSSSLISEYTILIKILFCRRVWKELFIGCKERGLAKVKEVLKKILASERHIAYLQQNEQSWTNGYFAEEKTIYYSYWLSSAALYLARNKQKLTGACITRAHGGDCFFSRGFIPWRKHILSNMDMIFPISRAGGLDILVHYGHIIKGLSSKIDVARLGVIFPESHNLKEKTENKVTIVSCSNIIPLKRLDLLIDALSLNDFVNIHWIHFGDGEIMGRIKSYARKKLVNNKSITYEFYGRVPKETILHYYGNHIIDLFINCSDAEGIPVSAMEAMSYGIPVIARNVGGIAELVDNNCGLLLPEEITPKDLSKAIKTVLFSEDGVLYQKRCVNAYKKIAEIYSADKNYECFFEKIQRLLLTQL